MNGYIDIKKLTLGELAGVVNLYPWFGGARKELCERMSVMGGSGWGGEQYADAAMYVGARGKLSDIMRSSRDVDWKDSDVERLLKSYIKEEKAPVAVSGERRRAYAGVGDYFSQDEYEQVRRGDDNVFSSYASGLRKEKASPEDISNAEIEIVTETLAEIYLDQGYPEQAKRIYSKLILAYPEKSVYFASLIEKIDELNQY